MALLSSEIADCKWLLGYSLLGTSAAPYASVSSLWEQVVSPNLGAGATTTSSTTVTAATTPTPVSLTLASGTGVSAGDRLVIDVDDRQEAALAQSITGAVVVVLLKQAHSGTYPVTVEGGEAIVREILRNAREVREKIRSAAGLAGLKRVDEIEWYQSSAAAFGGSMFSQLSDQLIGWADELSIVTGAPNLRRRRQRAGGAVSVY